MSHQDRLLWSMPKLRPITVSCTWRSKALSPSLLTMCVCVRVVAVAANVGIQKVVVNGGVVHLFCVVSSLLCVRILIPYIDATVHECMCLSVRLSAIGTPRSLRCHQKMARVFFNIRCFGGLESWPACPLAFFVVPHPPQSIHQSHSTAE